MSGLTASFADLLTALSQSFRLSAFFPAAMFVLVSLSLVGQYLKGSDFYTELTGSTFGELIFVFSLSLALGYALSVLNGTLTQLYEGHFFRNSALGRILTLINVQRREWLFARSRQYKRSILTVKLSDLPSDVSHNRFKKGFANFIRQNQYLQANADRQATDTELTYYFPTQTDAILPTKLGNVFASFEDYPRNRYSMESVTLWPRMVPDLLKTGYANIIEQEKMGFDFFLNLSFLSGLFALEYLVLSLYFEAKLTIFVPLLCLIMAWVFYRFAIRAGINYGITVRVAFDLHKDMLRESLGLEPPVDLDNERLIWESYSRFVYGYGLSRSQKTFVYPRPPVSNTTGAVVEKPEAGKK